MMFRDLKPYDAYTSLGESGRFDAPRHWIVKPMRALLRSRSVRNRPDLPLLSVARERGVFVRTANDNNHNTIPEDLTNYKVALASDLVINKMKAWQGSLGLAPCDGLVSPAYFVYGIAFDDRSYLQALLRSRRYVDLFAAASDGVRTGQWDLSINRFRGLPVLVPPTAEQAAIVKYLIHAHRRIDRAIAAKRKLVALLEEQTQAVVAQAVTRGLNVGANRREVGLPWLGSIPDRWELRPARAFLRRRANLVGSAQADRPLLSLTKRGVIVRDVESGAGKWASDMSTYQEVRAGQLVCCLFDVDETPRTVGLSAHEGMITGAYDVFDVLDPAAARFLEMYLIALDDKKALRPLYRGLRKVIPIGAFMSAKVPMPPADEREAIVEHVQNANWKAAAAMERAQREKALLVEFRTRLTSDVVTGQVDVRHVAATLARPGSVDDVVDVDVTEDELVEVNELLEDSDA